ncbi:dTDP-6-deoxy-L-hexose 3-O-methyltransferase [Magnetococcus marinus MC-1]|uniref:dTDP-6-deoxy-L-hexose 3-O-methyltransferase n=1 Tax=Magnetococcus marinus (strain ATCC BAA-1437 / JCM 17883 / MC-1) TaxID=156889 RepID=A0L5M0_MAGMM|nr:TylF/MycF/NovP-related O-methyltransferase [Magnetococcus marinus]ABK43263.1 dTDP-6-deoxy-L-hexose 3-O-methyltransferase [Magnetococcus marinus MC-1]
MKTNERGEGFLRNRQEATALDRLKELHLDLIPRLGENWNQHALVTLRRQSLSRILYYHWIYEKIVGKPGVICEFGVQWGSALTTLQSLRGIYEPYNHQRRIYGFDTFAGFVDVHAEDGSGHQKHDYATDQGYEQQLAEILQLHEQQSPLNHIQKTFLVKGDASQTITTWLNQNPASVIALAIFDMDVYKPTKDVLEQIKPRLFKGSVLVFDEFSCEAWPGETMAVNEVLGLANLRFEHFPHQPNCAIAVIE